MGGAAICPAGTGVCGSASKCGGGGRPGGASPGGSATPAKSLAARARPGGGGTKPGSGSSTGKAGDGALAAGGDTRSPSSAEPEGEDHAEAGAGSEAGSEAGLSCCVERRASRASRFSWRLSLRRSCGRWQKEHSRPFRQRPLAKKLQRRHSPEACLAEPTVGSHCSSQGDIALGRELEPREATEPSAEGDGEGERARAGAACGGAGAASSSAKMTNASSRASSGALTVGSGVDSCGASRSAKPWGFKGSASLMLSRLSRFIPLSSSRFVTSRSGRFVTSRRGALAACCVLASRRGALALCCVLASCGALAAVQGNEGGAVEATCTLAGVGSRSDSVGGTGRESRPPNCGISVMRSAAAGVAGKPAAVWRVRRLSGDTFSKSSAPSARRQAGAPMIGKQRPCVGTLGMGAGAKGGGRSCVMEVSGTAGLRST
mmetsp:Transcript_27780/g.82920  ORF Transcript_27780/g.82920 Transcript_27780/m.82920 type:complete len:432 (+) Transcript_27780:214-1509(+)